MFEFDEDVANELITGIANNIQAMEEQAQELTAQAEKCQADLEQCQADIEQCNADIESTEATIETNEQTIQELNDKAETLMEQAQALDDAPTIMKKVARTGYTTETYTDENGQTQTREVSYTYYEEVVDTAAMAERAAQVASMQQEAQGYTDSANQLQETTNQLKESLSALRESLVSLQAQSVQLQAQITVLNLAASALTIAAQGLTTTYEAVKAAVDVTLAAIDKAVSVLGDTSSLIKLATNVFGGTGATNVISWVSELASNLSSGVNLSDSLGTLATLASYVSPKLGTIISTGAQLLSNSSSLLETLNLSNLYSELQTTYGDSGINGVISYLSNTVGSLVSSEDASSVLNTVGTLVSYFSPQAGAALKTGATLLNVADSLLNSNETTGIISEVTSAYQTGGVTGVINYLGDTVTEMTSDWDITDWMRSNRNWGIICKPSIRSCDTGWSIFA